MSAKKDSYQEETVKLRKEVRDLHQQLRLAGQSGEAIQAENIDALFIASDKTFKVYTESTADKIYRILIEKMQEGAVTLTKEGTILYCNSFFARMVDIPLQKLAGTEFKTLIGFSKKKWDTLIKQSKIGVVSQELSVFTPERKITPVLMSMNILSIDNQDVLSVILTDLTIHHKNQA